MKTVFAILLLALVLNPLSPLCKAGLIDVMHKEEYFKLALPEGFDIIKKSPVEDFDIYTVSKSGEVYLSIYVGNQPTFPSLKKSSIDIVTLSKLPKLEMRSVWREGQLTGRELLIKLDPKMGWPMFLHVWTFQLPPDKVSVADRIISSLITNE